MKRSVGATTPRSDHSHLGCGISGVDIVGSSSGCSELDWEDEQEDVERPAECAAPSLVLSTRARESA